MKRRQVCKSVSTAVILGIAAVMCCGFWGSTEKDIDVKGIVSAAVVPFDYAKFKYFSENSGDIVAENMAEILRDKTKWTCPDLDAVKAAMAALDIPVKELMSEAQAKALGEKLGVDLVIFGDLPVYDEHEGSREILESNGGGFTENVRDLHVEYKIRFLRVSDGTLITTVSMERKERDTAKDPMQPDPPDQQLRHATRSMAKKLVKRFMTE
ncbi:MAG TPA: hypothetical protein PLV45_15160 [bacterium]|nr:hypothetical protein [bacterium]